MGEAASTSQTASDAMLTSAGARDRAIAGSVIRVGGYGVGLLMTAVSGVIVLRYLGVSGSGRYVTVTALIGIVSGITDAGLTVVGQREYVALDTPEQQHQLIALVLGLRLVLTPLFVLISVLFALAAGYGMESVLGVAICGSGLVMLNAAYSLSLPLQAEIRLGAVTATDLLRNFVIMAGIAALAATGCGFVVLFLPQVGGGAVALAMTLWLVGRRATLPSFDWSRIWLLAKSAAPVGASLALNVVYFRVLVLLMSLLSSAHSTGVYGASYRVIEALVSIPVLIVGAAFPILAHAGQQDQQRLAYVLQRLAEVGVLLGAGLAISLAVAARPVVLLLGGHGYGAAGGVLQIQCFALIPAFLTQVWSSGLIALRRQRALIVINVVALATVLILGLALIPAMGPRGAGIAAVAGETSLALAALLFLVRARRDLVPRLNRVPRILPACLVAAGANWLPLPGIPAAIIGAAAFCLVALAAGAVPSELTDLMLSRCRRSTTRT